MRPVTLVGEFAEFGDGPNAPSLEQAVGKLDASARERVATYLDAGLAVSAVPGFEPDVIDGSAVQLSRAHLTDGAFIWRRDLSHYVRKYGVGVPDALLRKAMAGAVPPRSLTKSETEAVAAWLQERFHG